MADTPGGRDGGRLAGRVALVTGGGNGIGAACCERFAEEGAAVVVADVLDEAGEATAAALRARGARAVFVHADAASPDDAPAPVRAAVEEFGGLDVLVTAAGISYAGYRSGQAPPVPGGELDPVRMFVELPLAAWQPVLDVNLTGTLLAVQAAARRMIEQGRGGAIVTVASIAAKHPEAATPAYSVSKAGVWMLTKMAARLLAPAGIRVNAVGPGFIETNMTAPVRERPELFDRMVRTLPMGRMGTPREVADAVLFLAADEASYVTGEMLHPDGGFYTE